MTRSRGPLSTPRRLGVLAILLLAVLAVVLFFRVPRRLNRIADLTGPAQAEQATLTRDGGPEYDASRAVTADAAPILAILQTARVDLCNSARGGSGTMTGTDEGFFEVHIGTLHLLLAQQGNVRVTQGDRDGYYRILEPERTALWEALCAAYDAG